MKITDVIETKRYNYSLAEFKKLLNITDDEKIDYISNMILNDTDGHIIITTKKLKQSNIGLDKEDKTGELHTLDCCKAEGYKENENNRTDSDREI